VNEPEPLMSDTELDQLLDQSNPVGGAWIESHLNHVAASRLATNVMGCPPDVASDPRRPLIGAPAMPSHLPSPTTLFPGDAVAIVGEAAPRSEPVHSAAPVVPLRGRHRHGTRRYALLAAAAAVAVGLPIALVTVGAERPSTTPDASLLAAPATPLTPRTLSAGDAARAQQVSFAVRPAGVHQGSPAKVVYGVSDSQTPSLEELTFLLDAGGNITCASMTGDPATCFPVAFDPFDPPLPDSPEQWLAAMSPEGWRYVDDLGGQRAECTGRLTEMPGGAREIRTECSTRDYLPGELPPCSSSSGSAAAPCEGRPVEPRCESGSVDTAGVVTPLPCDPEAAGEASPSESAPAGGDCTAAGGRTVEETYRIGPDGQIEHYSLHTGVAGELPSSCGSSVDLTMTLRSSAALTV